jgi:hypothetical protein
MLRRGGEVVRVLLRRGVVDKLALDAVFETSLMSKLNMFFKAGKLFKKAFLITIQ